MKVLKIITLNLLLLSVLTSCSELKNLANVQKPVLSLDDFRVSALSLSDIELTFDLQVDNPNPVALTLASYTYDFQIDQNSFVKGNQTLSSKIEANSKNIISVPVVFTFTELYNTFSSIKDKDETGYSFLANVGVNVPVLGMIEVPIQKDGVFPVVKAPTMSVSKFSVKNLSLTKADIELELNIDNPNAFGLILNKLDYNVDLNGLSPISGEISDKIEIAKNGSGSIKIPTSLNFLSLGMAAYNTLTSGKPFEYSLNGTADVGATLPFFESSSFNFNKSGLVDILK